MKTVVMETRFKTVVLLSILPLKQHILGVRITNKTDIFKTFLSDNLRSMKKLSIKFHCNPLFIGFRETMMN